MSLEDSFSVNRSFSSATGRFFSVTEIFPRVTGGFPSVNSTPHSLTSQTCVQRIIGLIFGQTSRVVSLYWRAH